MNDKCEGDHTGEVPPPIRIDVQSERLSASGAERFSNVCRALHGAMQSVLESSCGVSGFSFEAVLTEDLASVVNSNREAVGEDPRTFTVERVGGRVAAKCIGHASEKLPSRVVFADDCWRDDADEAVLASGCATIAHELAHCALHELRGRMEPQQMADDETVGEFSAMEIVRDALEEYRADNVANLFIGGLGECEVDGTKRPIRLSDVYGDEYEERLDDILSSVVYPGWRSRVQIYREGNAGLEEMFRGLGRSVWETVLLIAHAAAVARSSQKPDPLGRRRDDPGVCLYLAELWESIRAPADECPILPTPEESVELETEVLEAGVPVAMEMWRRLGLTFVLTPSGSTYIQVNEPLQ